MHKDANPHVFSYKIGTFHLDSTNLPLKNGISGFKEKERKNPGSIGVEETLK